MIHQLMEAVIKPNTPNAQSNESSSDKGIRANEQITSPQVRLILPDGENVGVISTREAIRQAYDLGLDLVEISSAGDYPVAKILDAGKYKYEMQKRKHEAKKKQKIVETKEIKFTPNIGENDYLVKMRNAKRFLEEGNKVKFTLRFRGREMAYMDLGMNVLRRVRSELQDFTKVEHEPKLEGRQMSMLISKK
ncbi:MAG: translation initiation factor IF-3 [Lactobacillales bacterium]|jgi:translation initiation factor IF-3|nr:translation initiation factor IF-3 [Lactobacillales bacterium]